MKRVIPSVYQFTDYNTLLVADFERRTAINSHYSLRSYARDLQLSPGYLSSVINGKKDFSRDNYKDIFSALGFADENELKFIENLIDYKTSKDQMVRSEALEYIKQHYDTLGLKDQSAKDAILNSSAHFIVFMLIEKISDAETVQKVAESFGVTEEDFNTVLAELLEKDYIARGERGLQVTERNMAITNSAKILECASQISHQLFYQMKSQGGITFPERSTHTLVLGFNEESFQKAVEVYKQFLHQIYRISKNSKEIDRTTVFTDVMMTAPINRPENT